MFRNLLIATILILCFSFLAEKSTAQILEKNNKVPGDLTITFTENYGWGAYRTYSIDSAGRVTGKSVSNMPTNGRNLDSLVISGQPKKPKRKKPKLKKKLSKRQIRQLVSKFEEIGLAKFTDNRLCTPDFLLFDAGETHIIIKFKGKRFSTFFYNHCRAKDRAVARKIHDLAQTIEKMIKTVRVTNKTK